MYEVYIVFDEKVQLVSFFEVCLVIDWSWSELELWICLLVKLNDGIWVWL